MLVKMLSLNDHPQWTLHYKTAKQCACDNGILILPKSAGLYTVVCNNVCTPVQRPFAINI